MNISLAWGDYAVIVMYFAAMLGIGWFFSKRSKKDATDFLLGGRGMPWFPVAVSMLMSVFSTYSLVMGPGEIYNHGLDWSILTLLSPFFGILGVVIFAQFFFKIKAFTPYEYLTYRYDKYVRLLAAFCEFYGLLLYGGTVLLTTGVIFESAAGWPCWLTIMLVGFLAIAYTSAGGLKAVVWTDLVQFIIMMCGIFGLVFTICRLVPGGAWGAVTYAFENGHGLDKFSQKEFFTIWPYVRLTFWALIIQRITDGLAVGVRQMTVQRLMSTGSVQKAVKAQMSTAFITIPLCLILDFIGLGIFSYYSQFPDPRVTSGDGALFVFVSTKLPFILPGIFIAAALSAATSTLSGVFNGEASVWLKEVHLPYLNKNLSDSQQVRVSKIATWVVGTLVIGFALLQFASMRWLGQTMVEVGMIFGFFSASVSVFNYGFAVFSRKASSLSFWSMTAFVYGFKDSLLLWYMLSKRGEVTFKATGDLGFAGPISLWWVLIPLTIALVMVVVALCRYQIRKWRLTWLVLAQIPGSFATGCLLWYIFSHTGSPDLPKVLSFTWAAIPQTAVTIGYMVLWHIFGHEMPKEHYTGLVWGHSKEDSNT